MCHKHTHTKKRWEQQNSKTRSHTHTHTHFIFFLFSRGQTHSGGGGFWSETAKDWANNDVLDTPGPYVSWLSHIFFIIHRFSPHGKCWKVCFCQCWLGLLWLKPPLTGLTLSLSGTHWHWSRFPMADLMSSGYLLLTGVLELQVGPCAMPKNIGHFFEIEQVKGDGNVVGKRKDT